MCNELAKHLDSTVHTGIKTDTSDTVNVSGTGDRQQLHFLNKPLPLTAGKAHLDEQYQRRWQKLACRSAKIREIYSK